MSSDEENKMIVERLTNTVLLLFVMVDVEFGLLTVCSGRTPSCVSQFVS